MSGRGAACAVLLVGAALLAGCTSRAPHPGHTDVTRTRTQTLIRTPSPAGSPIVAGPTTSAAGRCPFLGTQTAANEVGMRLAKVTVQRSGGTSVGCEFFALQGSPLSTSEHLPGPKQPAVRIESSRFADATAAHNAMVLLGQRNRNVQRAQITGDLVGVAFQTAFYPADHGQDWACAFAKGSTLVVVTTVVTDPSFNAVAVAKSAAGKF